MLYAIIYIKVNTDIKIEVCLTFLLLPTWYTKRIKLVIIKKLYYDARPTKYQEKFVYLRIMLAKISYMHIVMLICVGLSLNFRMLIAC